MVTNCPYHMAGKTHSMANRHEHEYRPPGIAAQRCTCGSRRWVVKVGGPISVLVFCERCSRENKTATAYERGRFTGLSSQDAKVPF